MQLWLLVIRALTIVLAMIVGANVFAASDDRREIMELANIPSTEDLDGITRRGFLRILTVHNPLLFSFDGDKQKGMVAELGKMLEDHLAEEIGKVRSPTVVLIPVGRNELISGLLEGRGDIVMGNLTITPERQKQVDFSPPIHPDVDELVITGPSTKKITSLDDLVETGLYVRRSSSYSEHLKSINKERQSQGKVAIPVFEADENLEDYDLLDMVNAGVLKAVVVDSHKAFFWEKVFENIVVNREVPVNSGNQIAWAIRKDSPRLLQSITAFSNEVKKGSLLGNILFKRYLGNTKWLENVLSGENRKRYKATIEIIKRYAGQYEFDWVVVAAQAYQESRFDQSKRSRVGAIGVMQLLPATAADKVVGIPDVSTVENNVHAGVKYLHWLRSTYFSDPQISPLDQILFSLAAYNAGPGNMKRARKRAKQLGFNENRWFGNVEIGMYRAVSGEPASYVRNIYKYYVTYQNLEESRLAREKALKAGPDYHGKMGAEASQETGVGKDSRLSNGALIGIVLGLLALGLVAYWIRSFYRRANSNA